MPSIPCPHCGRAISDRSKRCLYCAKLLGATGGDEADKRARMLAAMYQAGVGLPAAPKTGRLERLRDEPLPVKLAAALVILVVGLVRPFYAWRALRTLFRPE